MIFVMSRHHGLDLTKIMSDYRGIGDMKLKYLLIMLCQEQGYWDTSGYCHWSKLAFYNTEQFDLNKEEDLIKCLACFIEEYPLGEYEIHLVHPYKDWNYDEDELEVGEKIHNKILNIECEAIALSRKIAEQKELDKKAKIQKQRIDDAEQKKQEELKLLAQLKAKHESERD